ncbi:Glutamate-cysteine ligase catalytic subunit [Ceratobasidium theobromae]|uniref:Glutamate--cysteine ligase n=1 Tax=Ceratobasidium theobromae TaxID=1582974 RepID=A0A5N5QHH7_9AGAM|nr:Glutamate-cysteine ligase catalytic subunit [Ceratobasidium theobromae]
MGLLFLGTPLSWEEGQKYADYIREHGVTQFLNIWRRLKDREGDTLLWGDEIEYMVVSYDDENKNARLSLRQSEILAKLKNVVTDLCKGCPASVGTIPTFHPEYGRYMLESTPGSPYNGTVSNLLAVENNMRYRRKLAKAYLLPHEVPTTLTSFPRLGVRQVFTDPPTDPAGATSSHSLFLPEEITNPHARFPTLTANIRRRRGSKVAINVPIFFDTNTPKPFIDPTIPWERDIYPEDHARDGAAKPDHIYLDAMGFGMGCCCLQITFQACNVDEARTVYDALVPVAPIMMALTAAAPAYRGYLADVDCRWDIISGSVDDRTEEERGLKPLKNNKYVIPKSRYGSVDMYLSQDFNNRPEYNDIPVLVNEQVYQRLRDNNIDDLLAKHIAHLFIRDPLVVFSEAIELDDEQSTDHFESLQSTNWQSLRFKPPPANSAIGWRVEFRTMEVQPTDFENAAFSVFIVLLSRAILSFGLNFYIPISRVDDNMARAQRRGAARDEKFWFRKWVWPRAGPPLVGHASGHNGHSNGHANGHANGNSNGHINGNGHAHRASTDRSPPLSAEQSRCPSPGFPELGPIEDEYEEMTMDEIINGKGSFPGLLGVVNAYLDSLNVEFTAKLKLQKYLDLIKRRADGSLQTPATWIRNFVRSHPAYKFDSVVSQEINYDLIKTIDKIERGEQQAPELLPSYYVGSKHDDGCL